MLYLQIMSSKKLQQALAILLLYLLSHGSLHAGNLNAFVDNNVVQQGQFIQFSIKLSGKSATGDPDFSALKQDFDILSGISRSSETRIVNGQMSSASTWSITIAPKNDGALVIPPIHFAGEKTQPITVVVGKAPAPELADAFFEIEVSSDRIYVQAQLVLKTRLYIKVMDISNVQLDELRINDAQVISKGEPMQSQIVKDGIRYYLIEQQYFIFPEKSGEFVIPALNFSAIVNEAGSRYNRFGSKRRISAQSQGKTIEVKGVPANYPASALWLPAEELTLTAAFNPDGSVALGEPITMTITTHAKGLPATTLPPAKLPNISDLKIYPDQGRQEDDKNNLSVTGIRKDAFALLPNRSGQITIPEYKLPWWDTKNNQLRYAIITSKELNILENENFDSSAVFPIEKVTPSSSEQLNSDRSYLQNADNTPLTGSTNNTLLLLLLVAFGLLWLITIIFFVFYIRRLKKDLTRTDLINEAANEKLKYLLKDIDKACHDKNHAKLRLALIAWGQMLLEDSQIKGLSELAKYCEDDVLTQSFTKIDQLLFSGEVINGDIDFTLLNQAIHKMTKKIQQSDRRNFLGKQQTHKLANLYST